MVQLKHLRHFPKITDIRPGRHFGYLRRCLADAGQLARGERPSDGAATASLPFWTSTDDGKFFSSRNSSALLSPDAASIRFPTLRRRAHHERPTKAMSCRMNRLFSSRYAVNFPCSVKPATAPARKIAASTRTKEICGITMLRFYQRDHI